MPPLVIKKCGCCTDRVIRAYSVDMKIDICDKFFEEYDKTLEEKINNMVMESAIVVFDTPAMA